MTTPICTVQSMAVGSEFEGIEPSGHTLITGRGVTTYDSCGDGGLIVFSTERFTKISLIALNLDGATAHAPGACVGTLALLMHGQLHELQILSNEESYVHDGILIVPPGTQLSLAFVNYVASLTMQTMTVIHEDYGPKF